MCYLLGDWNINLLNYESHSLTAEFVDMLFSYGFSPTINRPTRITASTASLIDNIFTNNQSESLRSKQGILLTDITDHFPIFHIIKDSTSATINSNELSIVKRLFTANNKQIFQEAISKVDWGSINMIPNAQEAFTAFHEKLYDIFDKCFPRKKIVFKYNNHKPWLTDELKSAIKYKNKLYHISMKYKTSYNERMYAIHRNKVKHALETAEKEHYAKLFEINRSNMKKTWNILKSIINKKRNPKIQNRFRLDLNTIITDKSLISEKFNDFFVNIGPNLASKIPTQTMNPSAYLGHQIQHSIDIYPVEQKEFDDIMSSLK